MSQSLNTLEAIQQRGVGLTPAYKTNQRCSKETDLQPNYNPNKQPIFTNDLQVDHQPSTRTNCTVLGLQPHFQHGNWHNKPCHTHSHVSSKPPNKQQQTPPPNRKAPQTNEQTNRKNQKSKHKHRRALPRNCGPSSERERQRERDRSI